MLEARTWRTRDVNSYVSERLRQIRGERSLSQSKTGELLSVFVPGKWTVQAVSRAERCDGPYIKRWSVDDIYGLASAFEVPVTYFLLGFDDSQHKGVGPARLRPCLDRLETAGPAPVR